MIAILLLAAGAALCVSLVLFFVLRPRPRDSHSSKAPRRPEQSRRMPHDGGTGNRGVSARLVHEASGDSERARLSAAEREEMLEGVKNLAESNPEKVAGLIRDWMSADEDPRRS